MIKKMTLLAMVVGAVAAFAAPGMANAAKLTQPAGTLVKVGTTITGTSMNTVTVMGGDTIKCKKVVLHGIVAKNNGTTFEVTMDGENDVAESCEIVGLGPLNWDPTLNSITGTGATGHASFSFNVTGICTETSTATNSVTWNGTSTIHIDSGVTGGCGMGTLTGDFSIENAAGAAILVET